jgi:hypothetical protein
MKNTKRGFVDSHIRIEEVGWARETTIRELPTRAEFDGCEYEVGGRGDWGIALA